MDDAIWRLQAQSRALQERRADARGVWNDQAARTIEQRFLRPQLDADEDLRGQLDLQLAESTAAMADFDQAHETGNQATEVAAVCGNELAESTRAVQTAFQYAQHCREAQARALAAINTTLAAIDAANAAGSAAMRDPMGPPPLSQTPYSPLTSPVAPAGASAFAAQGLEFVDLADVDFSDNPVLGEFGRGGASEEDYQWAVQTWADTIQPGIQQGKTRDDFAAADAANNAEPLRRQADAYDMFMSDPIRLSRQANGTYGVIGGRHRIDMARRLGIGSLPAVIEG